MPRGLDARRRQPDRPYGRHWEYSRVQALDRTDKLEKELKTTIPFVFHRRGKPIRDLYKRWREACREAKVDGRISHDLAMRLPRRPI